jgi:putative restriction endonuclease
MRLDTDWQIRLGAMQALDRLRSAGGGVVSAAQLNSGFEFEGETIQLWSQQRGIWRPRQLQSPGAALTVVTAPRVRGRKPAYDDEVAHDERGWFGYKYEGTDPETWTNEAVRLAMSLRRPLIYLYGVTPGIYEPIYPVYVTDDSPSTLTFRLEVDVPFSALNPAAADISISGARREYQTRVVKHRMHQHRFRSLVLGAYRNRCTMCRLAHTKLLDAAHIIPDHDDRGLPLVSNGLALCKIHHSAFDLGILGIAPNLRVHVRADILLERDGPMLEHGLQAMEGREIEVPGARELRPNPDFLSERFEKFLAA